MAKPLSEGNQQDRLANVVNRIAIKESVPVLHTEDPYNVLLKIARKLNLPVIHAQRREDLLAVILEKYALP